jgi:hypothetical protein
MQYLCLNPSFALHPAIIKLTKLITFFLGIQLVNINVSIKKHTMKRNNFIGIIAVAAISLLPFTETFSQTTNNNKTTLRLAVGVATPTKSYMGDVVLTPDVRLQYLINKGISLTLTTGYYGFIGKQKANGLIQNSDLIPLKAGIKLFVGDNFYFQPEAGISFATESNFDNPFTWAPNLGYAYNKWDFSARYEGFENSNSSNGMVAVRLGYAF